MVEKPPYAMDEEDARQRAIDEAFDFELGDRVWTPNGYGIVVDRSNVLNPIYIVYPARRGDREKRRFGERDVKPLVSDAEWPYIHCGVDSSKERGRP